MAQVNAFMAGVACGLKIKSIGRLARYASAEAEDSVDAEYIAGMKAALDIRLAASSNA